MIRKYKSSDKEQVMQLWLNTNLQAHAFIADYWRMNYDPVSEQLDSAEIYVMEHQHEIKGFIGLIDEMIAGLFVDTKSQSMGIGKQLLDFVKEKKTHLQLCVYKKNEKAVHFYLRENFKIIHEQHDTDTNESEYLMKWDM